MSSGDRGATQALLGGEGPLVPGIPPPALCTGMPNVLQLHPLLATPPNFPHPEANCSLRELQSTWCWLPGHPRIRAAGDLGTHDQSWGPWGAGLGTQHQGWGIQDQGWAPETRDRHPGDQGQTPVPGSAGGAWGRGVKRRPPVPGSFPVYFLPY